MHAAMLRASLFFLHSTALIALLPLIARDALGGDARTFTLLLAAMGAGAIVAVVVLMPRLRAGTSRDDLVLGGTLLQAAAAGVVAVAPNAWVASAAMFVAGVAWITVANTLSVAAQLTLPDWVRAAAWRCTRWR
jgi:hypothetical protein